MSNDSGQFLDGLLGDQLIIYYILYLYMKVDVMFRLVQMICHRTARVVPAKILNLIMSGFMRFSLNVSWNCHKIRQAVIRMEVLFGIPLHH